MISILRKWIDDRRRLDRIILETPLGTKFILENATKSEADAQSIVVRDQWSGFERMAAAHKANWECQELVRRTLSRQLPR